jgi:hypothetical protein
MTVKKDTATDTTHYLVRIWGGVEPESYGPFVDSDERDAEARRIYEREDAICRLDIIDGVLSVSPYADGELPGDDEEEFED